MCRATERGRGPGAHGGSRGGGRRHMAGRVGSRRLRGPLPPPGPGCQRLLLAAGEHRLRSEEEGAETWGGARSPGKDPRSFPERKSAAGRAGGNEGGGRRESVAPPRPRGCQRPGPWRAARRGGRPQQHATGAPCTPRVPSPLRPPGTPGQARAGPVPASPWPPGERP